MAKTRHLSNKPRATKKRSQKKRSQRKRARTGKKIGGYYTHDENITMGNLPATWGSSYKKPQNSLIYDVVTAVGQVVVDIGTPLAVGVILYTIYMGAQNVMGMTQMGGKSSGIKGGSTTVDVDVTGLMKFLKGKSPKEVENLIETGGDLAKLFTPEQFTDIIQKFKKDMTEEERKYLEKLSKKLPEKVTENVQDDIEEVMENKNTL